MPNEAPVQIETQDVYFVLSSPLYSEDARVAEPEGSRLINTALMRIRQQITGAPHVACRPDIHPYVVKVTFKITGISQDDFSAAVNAVGGIFSTPHSVLFPDLAEGLTPGIVTMAETPEFDENGRPNVTFKIAPASAPEDNSDATDDRTEGLDEHQILVYVHAWLKVVQMEAPLIQHWCHKTGSSYELLASLFQHFFDDISRTNIGDPMTAEDAAEQQKFQEVIYRHAPSIKTIADEVRDNALPSEQTLSQGCVNMLMDGYNRRYMPHIIP